MATVHELSGLRDEFLANGFLLVPDVLTPDQCERYRAVMTRLDQGVARSVHGRPRTPGDTLEVRNVLSLAPEFLDLVDLQYTLSLMCCLMGYNIHVNTSHAFIRPPYPEGSSLREQKAIDWHFDVSGAAGAINGRLPWFYTRVGFFFTDVLDRNCGSLKVVPGSHRTAQKPVWREGEPDPYASLELRLRAGSAVVFDNRLWHASAPNYGPNTRMNVYFGYSWRWMRPIDYRSYPADVMDGSSPVRRQLLGHCESEMGYVFPTDADVPLKGWAREQGLEVPGVSTVQPAYAD